MLYVNIWGGNTNTWKIIYLYLILSIPILTPGACKWLGQTIFFLDHSIINQSINACGEVRCAPTSTAMDKESQARLHPTWDLFFQNSNWRTSVRHNMNRQEDVSKRFGLIIDYN